MNIKVYVEAKAELVFEDGICYYYFSCKDNNDIDTVYDTLDEKIRLNDPDKDLTTFQYLKDDDVTSLLEDAEKHGFISDYVIYYWKNKQKWR